MSSSFCWQCGKKLDNRNHSTRKFQGEVVSLHLACAKTFDNDQRKKNVNRKLDEEDYDYGGRRKIHRYE